MTISLASMGSYTLGGRSMTVENEPMRHATYSGGLSIAHDPNGHFWIEQAYVQHFTPTVKRFETPALFVHGGGLTGSSWETTPDGRLGFVQMFLEAGIAVHVLDNVERGRSGFCAVGNEWPDPPIMRSEEEAWSLYRFGSVDGAGVRTPFPGLQFPIEDVDELSRRTVPRWTSTRPLQLQAVRLALRHLGRAILVGHSQGGGLVIEAAAHEASTDGGVIPAAVISIEPHGEWPTVKADALAGRPLSLVFGDFIEQSETWRRLRDEALAIGAAWTAAGGSSDVIDLPRQGLFGNSHMPMMDRNSQDVANLLIEWLDEQFRRGAFT